jgi:tRNA A-37 threonylcarbamoyl transferase component Bud32
VVYPIECTYMADLERQFGKFRIRYYSTFVDPALLVRKLLASSPVPGSGRGGVRLVALDGCKLVVRQYRHGGLFRALTGDSFVSEKRVLAEAEILKHLREKGVPVVSPFCALVEGALPLKRLYLATVMEEESTDLLEYFQAAGKKQRLRIVKALARFFWSMEQAGVYHPDLHPRNVLVTSEGKLILLDFDKARKKAVAADDVASMFRRLGRFLDKMERLGRPVPTMREKALFLRVYDRLSGRNMTVIMQRMTTVRGCFQRCGWFIESLFYGRPE